MSNAPELLPCPFCGGEADLLYHGENDPPDPFCESWQVICGTCGAAPKCDFFNKEKAIAAWNTRADLHPKVKALEWEKLSDNCYRAKAPLFGNLRVETYGGKTWLSQWSVPGYCDSFVDGDFHSADEAKAATEARVLACLDMRPTTQKGERYGAHMRRNPLFI